MLTMFHLTAEQWTFAQCSHFCQQSSVQSFFTKNSSMVCRLLLLPTPCHIPELELALASCLLQQWTFGKSCWDMIPTLGQRSKAPTIAAYSQGDSRDFLPTAREWVTINSSHTTTHKYRKIWLSKCCKNLLYFLFPFHFSFYSCLFSIPCHEVPIKYLFSSFSHPGWPGWTRTQVGNLTSFSF
jgi:hypothetical protein